MRRFLDARGLEPDPGGSCVTALDKAVSVASDAGLDGVVVTGPMMDWVRTPQGATWREMEVFTINDPTEASMAESGALVSWAAGLMASKADDVGAAQRRRILDATWWDAEVVNAGSLKRLSGHARARDCSAALLPKSTWGEARVLIGGSDFHGGIASNGIAMYSDADDIGALGPYELVQMDGGKLKDTRFFTDKEAPDSYVATLIDIMGLPTDTTRVGVLAEFERREAARADRLSPTNSAPVEDRDEIYRRLRLANDKAEAALNALEATVQLIRMLRGGGDV